MVSWIILILNKIRGFNAEANYGVSISCYEKVCILVSTCPCKMKAIPTYTSGIECFLSCMSQKIRLYILLNASLQLKKKRKRYISPDIAASEWNACFGFVSKQRHSVRLNEILKLMPSPIPITSFSRFTFTASFPLISNKTSPTTSPLPIPATVLARPTPDQQSSAQTVG